MQVEAALQATGTDCGVSALRFFLQAFFGIVPGEVVSAGGADVRASMAQLISLARSVGVTLGGIEIAADESATFPRPYIWLKEARGHQAAHYVVALATHGTRELLFDPMFGYRSEPLTETAPRIALR